MTAQPAPPVGLNHLVINVRDIEESHRFWTEVVGLKLVGELRRAPERPNTPQMRFYSGLRGGELHHHDIALRENKKLPPSPAPGWNDSMPSAIGHVAIAFPSREVWLDRLAYLQARGVKFDRRVEHGMTHSLYIYDPNGYSVELLYELPREVWCNAAPETERQRQRNIAAPAPAARPVARTRSAIGPQSRPDCQTREGHRPGEKVGLELLQELLQGYGGLRIFANRRQRHC